MNGEKIPVYAADYVLAEYGTGAIMAVPAHDQRDLDFALAFGLPVRQVVDTGGPIRHSGIATPGDGTYINSGPLNGLTGKRPASQDHRRLEAEGVGEGAVTFRLRDWLLSRQRYWGCPIPIIHCERCGEVPVPDDQLPVELPYLTGTDLVPREPRRWPRPPTGSTSARSVADPRSVTPTPWIPSSTRRGTSSATARRATRTARSTRGRAPLDAGNQYVGGVEHAILHLLYMRFFTKVLHDMGMVDFEEPMRRLLNQGQVINQGKAMSKSLGNGVDLGVQIDAFGVDAVRLTVVFAGPPEEDIDWADLSPAGSLKFLQRAYRLADQVTSEPGATQPWRPDAAGETHRLLADIEQSPLRGSASTWPSRGSWSWSTPHVRRWTGLLVRRPGRPRGRRGGHHRPESGGAVRGRGDVGTAGPRPIGGQRHLADR